MFRLFSIRPPHLGHFIRRTISDKAKKAVEDVQTPDLGQVYTAKPFKYNCKAGKVYLWCSCGWSRTQPFCDGTHNDPKMKLNNKPIRFVCQETKDYWFCQCKQTKMRPFCDGSHNDLDKTVKTVNKQAFW